MVSVHSNGKARDKEIKKEKKMKSLIRQFPCGFVEGGEF
jgi:hypothetical protein